jgi:2-polyprenyl-3-methyl-5-hydroxy-6-metoxy-1,4-benzoquinol methylase
MTDNTKNIVLTVKDYTVSKETFGLYREEKYDMLVTMPKPNLMDLPKYYQSEDYISHSDKKTGLVSVLYQFVRSFTLKNKVNIIEHFQPEKGSLLDIGSGTGHFLSLAQHSNWTVTGIEPNEGARNLASEKGISFAESIQSIQKNSFDVITMWHVLEHVPDLDEQIKQLKRVLKPTGTLIIAVPNFRSYDAQHYKRFWAGYDVPRHLWHFSKKSIRVLFQEQNMKVIEMLPMKWDAFYVSLLSEKYKRGYMNFFKAVYIGFKSNYQAKQRFEYSSIIYVIKNDKNSK